MDFVFMPPHRMMPGAFSFSVFPTFVRAYECTSFCTNVCMYVGMYVPMYVHTYVILLDSG